MTESDKWRQQADQLKEMTAGLIAVLEEVGRLQMVPENRRNQLHQQIIELQQQLLQTQDLIESDVLQRPPRSDAFHSQHDALEQPMLSSRIGPSSDQSTSPYDQIGNLNRLRSMFGELHSRWMEIDYGMRDAVIESFVNQDLMWRQIREKYGSDTNLVVSIVESWDEFSAKHKLSQPNRKSSDSIDFKHLLKLTYSGHTQMEIADILGVAQPSIARRLVRAEECISYLIAGEKLDWMFAEGSIRVIDRMKGGIRVEINGQEAEIEYVILGAESLGKKVDSIIKKARKLGNDRPGAIYVCALYMPGSMEIRFCLAGDLAQMKSFNVPVSDHYDLREAGITGFSDLRGLVRY